MHKEIQQQLFSSILQLFEAFQPTASGNPIELILLQIFFPSSNHIHKQLVSSEKRHSVNLSKTVGHSYRKTYKATV